MQFQILNILSSFTFGFALVFGLSGAGGIYLAVAAVSAIVWLVNLWVECQ